jgi:hypothetical protein
MRYAPASGMEWRAGSMLLPWEPRENPPVALSGAAIRLQTLDRGGLHASTAHSSPSTKRSNLGRGGGA